MKGKVLSAFSGKKFYLLFKNSIDTSIKWSDREINWVTALQEVQIMFLLSSNKLW